MSIIDFSSPSIQLTPKQNKKITTQFRQYGWEHLPKNHPDFCSFLQKTKLIYKIRGYQNSLQDSTRPGIEKLKEAIHLDHDGHPCLLKQGEWTRWETLKQEISYNPKTRELVSRKNHEEEWNYFHNPLNGAQGLNPQTRYNKIEPTHQLSESEMKRLGMDGTQCLLQVFTTDVYLLSKVSHVGLRLIAQNGEVYSLGYEAPSWETKFDEQAKAGNYDAAISSQDYDEFTKFKSRRVTSIPITHEQLDMALNRAHAYSKQPLRFSRVRQNCATFAIDMMRAAQVQPPEITCKIREFFWDYIIDVPYLGKVLEKTQKVVQKIFEILSTIPIVGYLFKGITYVSNKMLTIIDNLLLLSFGGSRGSLPQPDTEDELDNRERLTYFSRVIKTWKDIFSDDTDLIFAPKRLIEWQLTHEGTVIHPYSGPKFYIAPPELKPN